MKSVSADFNRRGPGGAVRISLRRFDSAPLVGDRFVASDGEDRYQGTVSSVDRRARTVLLDMSWQHEAEPYYQRSR